VLLTQALPGGQALLQWEDLTDSERRVLALDERQSGPRFSGYAAQLRTGHEGRAGAALDYEVVKLFRNPVTPGNCFHDYLLAQAASQGAVASADRLAFLNQARQTLDANSYQFRFQGTWRALTGAGCPDDERTPIWRRLLAARGVSVSDPRQVMELIEKTADAFDRQFRGEEKQLAGPGGPGRLGFRRDSGLFVTSIFDTAFRLDRLVAYVDRQPDRQPVRRVLVAGPGLNIVDPFLGTQVPVSSPQPICLLESLLARGLADGRTRLDLVDLNSEVIGHWKQAAGGSSAYRLLAYLLAGEVHGEAGRMTRAYLDRLGVRAGRWFSNGPPRSPLLGVDSTGGLTFSPEGIHVREIAVSAQALRQFSPVRGDIVTDRLAEAGTHDLAVATNLLLYFDAREAALAVFNLTRLLRPGGYLFVTEDLSPVLPAGYPLARVWIDELKEAVPAGVRLPTFHVYRKTTGETRSADVPRALPR